MNPQRVVIDLEDGDGEHETFAVLNALRGLALVHQLPKTERVHQIQRHDGRVLVFLQIAAADADAWREALGAPAFTAVPQPLGVLHMTERFWFGATVRLSYSLAAHGG